MKGGSVCMTQTLFGQRHLMIKILNKESEKDQTGKSPQDYQQGIIEDCLNVVLRENKAIGIDVIKLLKPIDPRQFDDEVSSLESLIKQYAMEYELDDLRFTITYC